MQARPAPAPSAAGGRRPPRRAGLSALSSLRPRRGVPGAGPLQSSSVVVAGPTMSRRSHPLILISAVRTYAAAPKVCRFASSRLPTDAGAQALPEIPSLAQQYRPTRCIMAFSLYAATIPSFQQILGAVSGLLDKAEAFCAEKGIVPPEP